MHLNPGWSVLAEFEGWHLIWLFLWWGRFIYLFFFGGGDVEGFWAKCSVGGSASVLGSAPFFASKFLCNILRLGSHYLYHCISSQYEKDLCFIFMTVFLCLYMFNLVIYSCFCHLLLLILLIFIHLNHNLLNLHNVSQRGQILSLRSSRLHQYNVLRICHQNWQLLQKP